VRATLRPLYFIGAFALVYLVPLVLVYEMMRLAVGNPLDHHVEFFSLAAIWVSHYLVRKRLPYDLRLLPL
jgi:hypothetical protein